MHILTVNAAEQGMKLIGFLARRLGGAVSQNDLHRWIRTGQVRVNKGRAKAFDRLAAGDAVRLPPFAPSLVSGVAGQVMDEAMGHGTGRISAPFTWQEYEEISVSAGDDLGHGVIVLAVHEDFLALEKPPLLPSQPGTGHDTSLAGILREYFAKAAYVPAPAHRLDAATGGMILAGRTHEAQADLHALFASSGKGIEKTYLAWVAGNWPHEGETILEDVLAKETAAAPSGALFESVLVKKAGEEGKKAVSRVAPLARQNGNTLLEIVLETGRTHQIRVQLASRSHPVIGDAKYKGPPHPRLLLHAAKLVFTWKGETLALLSHPRWDTPYAISDKLYAKTSTGLF